MRARFLVEAAVAAVLQIVSPPAEAETACDDHTLILFKQKNDLPPGVLSALKFEMANVGQPFQATDAIQPGTGALPFRRFVSAQQAGCRLDLNYEHGGRSYSRETAVLENIDGTWFLRHAR